MSLQHLQEEDHPDEQESAEIDDGSSQASSFPLFSIILILSYSAVFAVQLSTGLIRSTDFAGFDKQAFLYNSEFWRILTGATLHGSIIHIVMNTIAFYSFGRTFEMLTSRSHLPIVFLASAIGGALLSLVADPIGVSVGASGGIIGLVGYLVVYSFKRREFISSEFRQSLIFNIGFILFYGFVLANSIDNFAHIGGLLTGALYAFVEISSDGYTDPRIASPAFNALGMASMGIYIAACIFAILVIVGFV